MQTTYQSSKELLRHSIYLADNNIEQHYQLQSPTLNIITIFLLRNIVIVNTIDLTTNLWF